MYTTQYQGCQASMTSNLQTVHVIEPNPHDYAEVDLLAIDNMQAHIHITTHMLTIYLQKTVCGQLIHHNLQLIRACKFAYKSINLSLFLFQFEIRQFCFRNILFIHLAKISTDKVPK